MLSLRHSIGIRPPLATLVRGSKSVPDSRCYASPPPTEICARGHMMNIAELPYVEAAYDKVGAYDQDAINGFSEQMLHTMLDLVNPAQASDILDAMAGNGNLTLRLYDYCRRRCRRRGITLPNVVLLELSRVQCELAKTHLAYTPAKVIWGDILNMEDYERDTSLPERFFDR